MCIITSSHRLDFMAINEQYSPTPQVLQETLTRVFGFSSFRPGQAEVVEAGLAGGRVLGVMPTGGGKSLCYQIASVLRPGGTLVISPLIALMKDQVDSLQRDTGLRVALLNSSVSRAAQSAALDDWVGGRLDLLYTAPERFRNKRFLDALTDRRPQVIAIDEAHCVSQWGHDFRPDYLFLKTAIQRLSVPVVMALTATATREVRQDVLAQLGIEGARTIITGFDRPNLRLEVLRLATERAKRDSLRRLLAGLQGSGIVYCGTRKESAATAELIRSFGRTAEMYHGEMDAADRSAVQTRFMAGRTEIVCATNAFGLGVNKADIRFVIHTALPGTLEALYQEMGRAGRDGEHADCVLLFAPSDLTLQRFLIQASTPTKTNLDDLHAYLTSLGAEARFSWADSAQRLGVSQTLLRSALGELEKAGLARRKADTDSGDVRVEMLFGANPQSALQHRALELDKVRANRLRKLQSVEAYARLTTCRRACIRRYFGEEQIPDTCTNCDNCLHSHRSGRGGTQPFAQRSSEVAMTILQCVGRYSGKIGRTTVVRVLAGSNDKRIVALQDWYAEYHGRLKNISRAAVGAAMDELLEDGYIEAGVMTRNESALPVVQITALGRQVLSGQAPAPAVAVSAPRLVGGDPARSPVEALTEADMALFEALRAWRIARARALEGPAYTIASDAVLRGIAAVRPATEEELLAVRGMGPGLMAKWGADILAVVRQASGGAASLPDAPGRVYDDHMSGA
ncbi:MAG TPA: ATP-dependent DNA helicase RecQ [Armatimonadota bacterium]|jgi:ATP-dependent DNA helicase RecQ